MSRFILIALWLSFAGWVGWMYWQAHSHGRFPVVSRAQLLTADVAVVAEIKAEPDGRPVSKVKVAQAIWPNDAPAGLAGRELEIVNLPGCDGFRGPGRYVLLLSGQGEGPYHMAESPRTPLADTRIRPRMYPDEPDVIGQLRQAPGRSLRVN